MMPHDSCVRQSDVKRGGMEGMSTWRRWDVVLGGAGEVTPFRGILRQGGKEEGRGLDHGSQPSTAICSPLHIHLQHDLAEESGWKMVHGDVFRPPRYLVLLAGGWFRGRWQ